MFDEKDWNRIKKKAEKRKKFVEKLVKNIDPELAQKIKKFFENNFLDLNQNMTLQVIIDASILNSHVRVYLKHKHSILLDILTSPFVQGIAPLKLVEEITDKIDKIAKDCDSNATEVRNTANLFLAKIKLQNLERDEAFKQAQTLIAKRDKTDVEYVALYIRLGGHAIFSSDKDILEIENIETWKSAKEPCEIISIYQQGTVSFLIFAGGVPILGIIFFELLILTLYGLLLFVALIIDKIIKIVKQGYKFVSSLPAEWKLILGIATITLLLWDESREIIFDAIKNQFKKYIQRIISFINFIKPLLAKSGKWTIEEIMALGIALIENIEMTITQLNLLEDLLQEKTNLFLEDKKSEDKEDKI